MNWLLLGFAVLMFICWRENRARKQLWAKRRLENAAAMGKTLPEYDAWLKSVS